MNLQHVLNQIYIDVDDNNAIYLYTGDDVYTKLGTSAQLDPLLEDIIHLQDQLALKQNIEAGKGLSTNDYTNIDKDIVVGITSYVNGIQTSLDARIHTLETIVPGIALGIKGSLITSSPSPTVPGIYIFTQTGTYFGTVVVDLSAGFTIWVVDPNTSTGSKVVYPFVVTLVNITGNNLFNKAVFTNNQLIRTSDGALQTTAGYQSSIIQVDANQTKITYSGFVNSGSKAGRWEDSSNQLVGTNFFTFAATTGTLTKPVGATQIRITWKNAADASTVGDALMVNYGSTALAYEAYTLTQYASKVNSYSIQAANVATGAKLGLTDLVAGTSQLPTFTFISVPSKNLYDDANLPTSPTNHVGRYLTNANATALDPQYCYTDYIPVTAGLPYTGWDGSYGMRYVTYYDSSKVLVTGGFAAAVKTFTPPAGVAFVRVTFKTAARTTFQFEQSATNTSYAPFTPTLKATAVNGAPFDAGTTSVTVKTYKEVTLKTVPRAIIIADSYNSSPYVLKAKAPIAKVSQFTDWNVENYAKSGDSLPNMHSRILADSKTFHPQISIKDFQGGGYAIICSYTNDTAYMDTNVSTGAYLTNFKQVANDARALGYIPIICTEHLEDVTFSLLYAAELSNYAFDRGYTFGNLLEYALQYEGTRFVEHYFGKHPGVRTNTIFWYPFYKIVRTLQRPPAAIKIGRNRASVTITDINQFATLSTHEWNKVVKEIYVTQAALGSTSEKYYDSMKTLSDLGTITTQNVYEYLNLMNGENVNFPSHATFNFVVDAEIGNISYFHMYFSADQAIDVFIRDYSRNIMTQLTPAVDSDNVVYYEPSDYKTQCNYDKFTVVIRRTGGGAFNINNVFYRWDGLQGKDYNQRKPIVELATPDVWASTGLVTTLASWTVTGTVAPITPVDSCLPAGTTKVVTLTTTDYIKQNATFPADTTRSRKVQIKAVGRINPAEFPNTSTYGSNAPINDDTYDEGQLLVTINSGAGNFFTTAEYIGLHYTDPVYEFLLPSNVTTVGITFKAGDTDKPVQFAKASVRIEA